MRKNFKRAQMRVDGRANEFDMSEQKLNKMGDDFGQIISVPT